MSIAVKESFGATEVEKTLTRPDSGSLVLRADASNWEQDGDSGFSYKTLFEDDRTGQETLLMKVDAGALAPPHGHDKLEQVYILDGDFYDEYHSYGPGDFVVRAPGAVHTGGTKNGAVVLLVYSG